MMIIPGIISKSYWTIPLLNVDHTVGDVPLKHIQLNGLGQATVTYYSQGEDL